MADVEMPDVGPSAPAKIKASAKTSKGGPGTDSSLDGKKRFEVKKVRTTCETETLGGADIF